MSGLAAIYMYTDGHGRPVIRKLRREPKQFNMEAARYRADRLYWKCGPGVLDRWQPEWRDKALYNLPVLLDGLRRGDDVFITEGERDCDVATALWKLPATTNWQGAGEFIHQQAAWFTQYGGKSRINLLVDNDDAGHWAVHQRRRRLLAVGVDRKRVRLLRPPGAVKDVAEAALAGLSLGDFVRVSPRAAREVAEAYGAERAARYAVRTEDAS